MFKTKPYAHQSQALSLMEDKTAYALLMEQGCVDSETEYLSPTGWKKISEYTEGKVAQFDPETGVATFVDPIGYIKRQCDRMIQFKTKYGIDQLLSPEHRVLHYARPRGITGTSTVHFVDSAADVAYHLGNPDIRRQVHIKATFKVIGGEGLDLTNDQLRLQVAVIADGHFPSNTNYCVVRLKRERKIIRLANLLSDTGIDFKVRKEESGFVVYSFYAPLRVKKFDERFWTASNEQLDVIADEVIYWDGSFRKSAGKAFYSTEKESVDFIQYVFVTRGHITRITDDGRGTWCSYARARGEYLALSSQNGHISPAQSTDGFKYCFEVPTSFLVFRRNNCVFVSGNTGKTKCLIDDCARLFGKGRVNALVVVAPNGVHRNWIVNEIPTHLPDWAVRRCAWWSSPMNKSERAAYDALFEQGEFLRVFTMNVEALATKKGVETLQKFLQTFQCYLVVDESSKIKTHNTERTKALLKLGKYAAYRRIATGTPVTQSPLDVWSQFEFLDESIINIPSFYVFKARYAELVAEDSHIMRHIMQRTGARRAPQVVAKDRNGKPMYKNMEELQRKIAPYSFRVLKADCLDLPDKLYQRRYFSLNDEQRRTYKQITEDLRVNFEDGEFLTMSKLTAILRLQQVTSGYIPTPSGQMEYLFDQKNPRVTALMEALEEISGKVIIWARFVDDIKIILTTLRAEYGEKSVVAYYGEVSDDNRVANVKAFQEDPQVRFFVGNQQAGGTGLTLTAASTVIYYTNDFSLENRLQSEDRAHRIGQKNNVTYIDIEAGGTVDTKIINALRTKRDVASLITNDPITTWL